MEPCARCGHTLGVGRYCVNCGHPRGQAVEPQEPDDWRTGTAERPAVPAAPVVPPSAPASPSWTEVPPAPTPPPGTPPAVFGTPPRPRFPMYADEPAPEEPTGLLPAQGWGTPAAGVGTPADGPDGTGHRRQRGRSALPWVLVAAVVLLLVAAVGVFLVLRGGDDGGDATASDPSAATTTTDDGRSEPAAPPSAAPPTTPSAPPTTPTPSSPTPPAEPEDVTRAASALAPVTAPPSVDVDGNAVRYDATNMLDGQDDTAWRAPGDASGQALTFTLDGPTRLTSLGLLNGYAKTDPGYDGYTANRRVLAVEWVLDDGTVIAQTLGDSRTVQTVPVGRRTAPTTTVRLRLVSVSPPAPGPQGRDFTAISTVALLGVPEAGSR